jgi:hypothetical protein
MNSTSEEIIQNLNKRLLTQGVIIESLCDLLIDSGIFTEDELNEQIKENIHLQQEFIDNELSDNKETSKINLMGLNFGPIGEC